ncbi:hypothetical protein [Halomonas urmiana]|uniref:hypothetical protein n=1 Tax=Halomonas urmiana TaxID=490901 RepID=UPI0013050BCA|nr:hypothetical protein [Halomonas urmiana]
MSARPRRQAFTHLARLERIFRALLSSTAPQGYRHWQHRARLSRRQAFEGAL